ncbi:MAG: SDR family oxidoreductase [Pseudonocardia sp.]
MAQHGKILVTGATGKVGHQVVVQLAAAGADVRALARHPDAMTVPPGVEVARGDLSDPASLQEPLRDIDAVFLMWPFLDADGAVEVLDVIKQHARRVVYLSAAGVDIDLDEQISPIHQFHAAMERAVQRSGLEWVFLRPYSFASNNLDWADQVRTGVVRAPGAAHVRAMIHESDIAAVAVAALTGDTLVGTRPELTGPEALTTAEQAAAIGEALGMPVRFEEIPHDVARAEAVAAGYPDDLVAALFDSTTAFPPQPVTSTVQDITGHAPRSIRQWALDHADAFRS